MLLQIGLVTFAAGLVLVGATLYMGWKRRRSLAESAIDTTTTMFDAMGSLFGSTSKDDLVDNIDQASKNILQSQACTAKKNWLLIVTGVLGKLCLVVGAILVGLWIIHAIWVWAF